jgi:hypothetical protein
MAGIQDVAIRLDEADTGSVCDYSVGFLKFERDDTREFAKPAGTGTFVKVGRVVGILTAAHVLKELDTENVVGLVRFPSVRPPIQNRRLNLQHTNRIVEWNGKECDAPDIAFLKIPEIDGRGLEAEGSVFYNLDISREFVVSRVGHRMGTCYAVVGVVGEWTQEHSTTSLQGLKVILGGLFGAVKSLRAFKEAGIDLIEVEVDYANGPRVPTSYGGVSGGALWQLHVELDAKLKTFKVNKRLHGVAFRQSVDHRRITSNASPSIDALVERIRAEWPEAVRTG